MRRFALLTIALFAVLAAPARGAGAPIAGYDPLGQVTSRGLDVRYAALPARGGTVVMAVRLSTLGLKWVSHRFRTFA